jgi:hypothetical protein
MNLSPSHTLANSLRSALWMVNLYSNMNENGPALHELKIAIGRAIVELEAHAAIERSAAAPLSEGDRIPARLLQNPEQVQEMR